MGAGFAIQARMAKAVEELTPQFRSRFRIPADFNGGDHRRYLYLQSKAFGALRPAQDVIRQIYRQNIGSLGTARK